MITFQITYDENIPKCTMGINNQPLSKESKLNDYVNTPLERWIDYLLYQLPVETGDRDIHILFAGSDEAYELVREHVQNNLATRKDAQFTVMRKSEFFSHTKEREIPKEQYTEQKNEMEELVRDLDHLTFDVLWMKKEKISEIDAIGFVKEPYLSLINTALATREKEDLDAICDEIVNYDMEQCNRLEHDIAETLYSKSGIEFVKAQIEKRKRSILEVEQAKELERLFFGVETFDKDKLNELEAYLRSGKYLNHLIEPYIVLVDQRKEILNRAEVELLCESYLTMSLEELEGLKQRLLSGEFEELYVLTYVKLIEVRMDELAVIEIEMICRNVDEERMEGAEEAIRQLTESGFKERLWKPYEVALRVQKVYLEKLSLVKKCNDFNQLTQSEAMHLLEWVKEQEINEGTKQAYSQWLTRRIHNIQGMAVYRYSVYLQNLLKNTQVGNLFCLTLISKDYYPKVQELRKNFKEFDDFSMPIGIMEGAKSGDTLIFKDCLMIKEQGITKKIPFSEIRNIEVTKKMLQAQVVVTTHRGPAHPLLTVMGHKKGEEISKVLLNLIDTIRTRVSLPDAMAPETALPLWSRSVGEAEKLDHVITTEKVIQRFLMYLNQIDELRMKYVFTYTSPDWQKKLDKARENFAKFSMEEIPFILWDASKGNFRYGMCVTDRRIYVKTAGGTEYDVSLGQIYEIIPYTTEKGVTLLLKLTDTKTQELPFEPMTQELALKWKVALEEVLEGILECQNKDMIQNLIAKRPMINLEENYQNNPLEALVKTPVQAPVADALVPEKEMEIPKAEPLVEEEVPVFVPKPEPEVMEPEIMEPEIIEPEITEPEVVEPVMEEREPEPEVMEAEVMEPEIMEPEIIEPEIIEPVMEEREPETEVMEPEVMEPEIVEPEIIEPVMEEREPETEVMEPEVIEPEIVEPEIIEPVMEEREPEPEVMEPEIIEPEIMEPVMEEREPEPEVMEPEIMEPEVVEPVVEEREPAPELIEPEEEILVEASEESFLDIDALIDRIISGE